MLMDGLKQMNLDKCVNLLLLSDHGMEESRCENIAYLTSYINSSNDFIVVNGPAARLRPVQLPDAYFSFDYAELAKNLSCRKRDQHFKPFLKQYLPKRLHFANNDRIESLHFYCDPKWQVAKSPAEVKVCKGGFHGSDNLFKSMQALFIGYGSKIKHGIEVPPFENIEIYNLLCDLLDIEPAPNNGTRGSLNHLLKQPVYEPSLPRELSEPFQCSVIHGAKVNSFGCSCDSLTEAGYKKQLTLTPQQESNTKKFNLPYGRPLVLQNSSYCILYHNKYVSGFSYNINMPLWSSYTLHKNELVPASVENNSCIFVDVRIPQGQSQSCQYYRDHQSLKFGFLFPPSLIRSSKDDGYSGLTTSNMIPMYPAFQGVWKYFHDILLAKYTKQKNGINVISGPVFDYDFDGRYDSLEQIKQMVQDSGVYLPTHYFIILTSCKNSSETPEQCSSLMEVISFIVPHREDYSESCAEYKEFTWIEELFQLHVARVKDIELLTALSFFHNTNFSVSEILKLKTFLHSYL